MIELRQDVLPLLDEYINTQYEWIRLGWIPDTERWDSQRKSRYWNGIPLGKFRERYPMTMLTLEEGVADNALRQELLLYYEREREAIQDQKEPDILQRMRLPCLLSQFYHFSLYVCRWRSSSQNIIEIRFRNAHSLIERLLGHLRIFDFLYKELAKCGLLAFNYLLSPPY